MLLVQSWKEPLNRRLAKNMATQKNMPKYNLTLRAELENVESITAAEDTIWRMKIECGACGTVSAKYLDISALESVEVPGSRGTCNCLYTCKEYFRRTVIS